MIENKYNFLYMCRRDLGRMISGTYFGRETRQGVLWAIEFVKGLDHDVMTDVEIKHAVRCTTYRGSKKPVFNG